ncbi:hypothetical protein MTO96_046900 [Rhipicephalus appendiculatus]
MGGSRTLFCILQLVVGAAGCGNCSQVPTAGAFAIGPTASEVSSNATSPGIQWLNSCSHDQLQGFLPYRALPQLVAAAGTSTDPPTPRLKPSAAQSPLNGLEGTRAMGGSRTLFCILQLVVGAAGCGNCSQVPSTVTTSFKVSCLIVLYLNSWQLQEHRQTRQRPVENRVLRSRRSMGLEAQERWEAHARCSAFCRGFKVGQNPVMPLHKWQHIMTNTNDGRFCLELVRHFWPAAEAVQARPHWSGMP